MRKTVVLTGGTGFIGNHLTKKLVDEDYNVHLIIREESNIQSIAYLFPKITLFKFKGNTNELIDHFRDIGEIDIVIHLASMVVTEHSTNDIENMIDSNLKFGTQLLEAMRVCRVKHIINTGTYWQHYNNEVYNPVALYAATKEAFEKIIDYYVEACEFKCFTLELFDAYGLNDNRRKIINLLKECAKTDIPLYISKGEQYIDFVYIDDILEAYLLGISKLLTAAEKVHNKYSVSTNQPIQLKELVELFETTVGKKINVYLGDREYRKREIMYPWNKGELLPDWKPKIDIAAGIKMMLE
jgi:nucleoside-diphosphate-sugar epimerase